MKALLSLATPNGALMIDSSEFATRCSSESACKLETRHLLLLGRR
jgi:hypothetical protein